MVELIRAVSADFGCALEEVASDESSGDVRVQNAPLGRLLESAWYINGTKVKNPLSISRAAKTATLVAANQVRDGAIDVLGAPWVMLEASMAGPRKQVWVDFDARPGFGRWVDVTPELLMGELMVTPRPAELTPAWMKVDLATAGLWDVERDCSAWSDDWEPTGHPVTREVAKAAFAGQRPVAEVLFGTGGPPPGFSRENPLVIE